MKFFKDIKLHFVTVIMFGIMFPVLIWAVGLIFPHQANGLPIYKNEKLIGFENIGQKFTSDKYFWGRPSAVDYNAAATGGSNKGPTNPEYLALVEQRIKEFMEKNPGVKRSEIPADLVTASGSGIDPHISLKSALIQVPRVANERMIKREVLKALVYRNLEKPLLGFIGTEAVNVLKLNLAVDKLMTKQAN